MHAEEKVTPTRAGEASGRKSIDTPTSAEEEAATILSEVLGDLHRHAEAPIEKEHVVAPVTTSSATSDSSHSSDEIPLKDRVAQIAKGKKAREKPSVSSKKEKKKKVTQQAKDGDEERFLDKASKKKFESVEERGIVVERMIDELAFEKFVLIKLLQERSLYKSATFPESYSLSLVQEFYSNLLPSDKGITRLYVRGKWIPFTPACLNRFLEFKLEVKGNYEEGLELNEENWLPVPHNSNIVKELALLLFAIGTGKKFNLGRLIFQTIVKEADYTSSSTSLGYPGLLS
ncbi:uncharacterized protein LOC120258688 [Dioscorea cayenensis subsp. rotundata]|uniref:Uncharacterized protein LOC120258688 n=1 Tax=Dioscorea cayennensis subsp. rotundata TaxID=55577 RepID=A0AB40B5Z2_DIOCR|nr:uncharacterized protein LOC120258688 [Dioscorea cayenensis subsp. rotundata]